MKIDFPLPSQSNMLVSLWQEAFGDTLTDIEGFYCTGFSPSRCRCVTEGQQVVAALYWFDVTCRGQRMAYLYAIATAQSHRNRGICSKLLADTHVHLAFRGYTGAILVPQTPDLAQMYRRFGYMPCTQVREFSCQAGDTSLELHRIDREEYARLRRAYLPEGGAIQEAENIAYLETMAFFYRSDRCLLAARKQGRTLLCPELLGDADAAPQILKALGCQEGQFRTPGQEKDFAMFLPLAKDARAPGYFGLAFD